MFRLGVMDVTYTRTSFLLSFGWNLTLKLVVVTSPGYFLSSRFSWSSSSPSDEVYDGAIYSTWRKVKHVTKVSPGKRHCVWLWHNSIILSTFLCPSFVTVMWFQWVRPVPPRGLPLWLHLVWWSQVAPPTLTDCGPETRWLRWVARMKTRRMEALEAECPPSWFSSCWDPRCRSHPLQCLIPTGFIYIVSATELTENRRVPCVVYCWASLRKSQKESVLIKARVPWCRVPWAWYWGSLVSPSSGWTGWGWLLLPCGLPLHLGYSHNHWKTRRSSKSPLTHCDWGRRP